VRRAPFATCHREVTFPPALIALGVVLLVAVVVLVVVVIIQNINDPSRLTPLAPRLPPSLDRGAPATAATARHALPGRAQGRQFQGLLFLPRGHRSVEESGLDLLPVEFLAAGHIGQTTCPTDRFPDVLTSTPCVHSASRGGHNEVAAVSRTPCEDYEPAELAGAWAVHDWDRKLVRRPGSVQEGHVALDCPDLAAPSASSK